MRNPLMKPLDESTRFWNTLRIRMFGLRKGGQRLHCSVKNL